mmetsp:Transcript_2357/g.5603  ORF Transcript_2357/g.5603 Transcript_2357/m.5603 type:complete len:665 (+) Transcript_2357:40-2034(+)|eukprot:CAMPEP_0177639616 /NCGR_PEP_ID=MMETSP0447-20121125/6115_1 /TAXON_ID=0 /ORGANISM="Stygamoeba regulata, Strain BSH-02190019" /LENGTH=664 /DNA_ID=CAMNT_0019141653 /DNA_START=40 /DNA_END=2034 /DNA_ORIENTATION=-
MDKGKKEEKISIDDDNEKKTLTHLPSQALLNIVKYAALSPGTLMSLKHVHKETINKQFKSLEKQDLSLQKYYESIFVNYCHFQKETYELWQKKRGANYNYFDEKSSKIRSKHIMGTFGLFEDCHGLRVKVRIQGVKDIEDTDISFQLIPDWREAFSPSLVTDERNLQGTDLVKEECVKKVPVESDESDKGKKAFIYILPFPKSKSVPYKNHSFLNSEIANDKNYLAPESDDSVFLDIKKNRQRRDFSFSLTSKVTDDFFYPFNKEGWDKLLLEMESNTGFHLAKKLLCKGMNPKPYVRRKVKETLFGSDLETIMDRRTSLHQDLVSRSKKIGKRQVVLVPCPGTWRLSWYLFMPYSYGLKKSLKEVHLFPKDSTPGPKEFMIRSKIDIQNNKEVGPWETIATNGHKKHVQEVLNALKNFSSSDKPSTLKNILTALEQCNLKQIMPDKKTLPYGEESDDTESKTDLKKRGLQHGCNDDKNSEDRRVTLELPGNLLVQVALTSDGSVDEDLVKVMTGFSTFFMQEKDTACFTPNEDLRPGTTYLLHSEPLCGATQTERTKPTPAVVKTNPAVAKLAVAPSSSLTNSAAQAFGGFMESGSEIQRFLAENWRDSSDMIKKLGRPAHVLEDAGLNTWADLKALDQTKFDALPLPLALKKLLSQEIASRM